MNVWAAAAILAIGLAACNGAPEKKEPKFTNIPPAIQARSGPSANPVQPVSDNPDLDAASQSLVAYIQYIKTPNYKKDSALAMLLDARKSIDKAIQVNKNDPEVIYTHALIQVKEKNYDGAIQTIEDGIKSHPNFEKFYNGLGNLYLKRGNKAKAYPLYEKSIELYDQILAKDPNNTGAVNKRAFALYLLDRKDEAIKLLESKIPTSPMPSVLQQSLDGYKKGFDLKGYLDNL